MVVVIICGLVTLSRCFCSSSFVTHGLGYQPELNRTTAQDPQQLIDQLNHGFAATVRPYFKQTLYFE